MLKIFIVLQKELKREGKNQHAVITNANTSTGIKISTFLEKVEDTVVLVHYPLTPSY